MKKNWKTRSLGMGSVALLSALTLGGIAVLETAQSQGRFGRMGERGAERLDQYDANSDGAITQNEIDAMQQERFERFDTDANGLMSLEEYGPFWQERNRSRMVERFQRFDDDGNSGLTPDEFEKRSSKLVIRLDANNDGVITVDEMGSPRRRGMRGRSRQ
jgi:hypothetical protein